jgi:hypothetical protein
VADPARLRQRIEIAPARGEDEGGVASVGHGGRIRRAYGN